MKNPLTPAGIEPATFRFVAQHCATAVPRDVMYNAYFLTCSPTEAALMYVFDIQVTVHRDMYSYNKTSDMQYFLKFIFGVELYI